MKTLFILRFLFWSLLRKAESTACPQPTPDSRDVTICSEAGITNVSIARVIPKSSEMSNHCFCDIKLYKPTILSFAYYGPDTKFCGIEINIDYTRFSCDTGPSFISLNQSTIITYSYLENYDWCMDIKTEQSEDQDARFSVLCKSDTVKSTSSLHPSMPHVVSESTTPSSDMKTTYVKLTSYPSSPLPITDANATNATVTNAFHLTSAPTGESQSSYHKTSVTTSSITQLTSSKSQPRQALKDIHIVIIAVGSTCCLLVAITVSAICCFVCSRRAKGTHNYVNNQLDDTTNLRGTHDYPKSTNHKDCDFEVINQMYVPADDTEFNPTNPSEPSTDYNYAPVGELIVEQNLETDIVVVNSASKESDRGITDNAEINESVISEPDVDKLYSVVQKNRDTDSKAKKVSFSVSNQDVPALSTESHGTHDVYARVNKTS